MLKINEDGSCQRIGPDGQPVAGEEPRKIEEFGPGGLDTALKSIKKAGEAHEVTAVRGKFSKIVLKDLDSSDEEEPVLPTESVDDAPKAGGSKASEPEATKVEKVKEDLWKIPVRFLFLNKTGRFLPMTEVEVKPNSSIEVLLKAALKVIGIKPKEISDLQMQEMAHGVTKKIISYSDTINPQGLYSISFQHRFAVVEPIIMNVHFTAADGTVSTKNIKHQEEAVDAPSTTVFKYLSGERFLDLNSVKAQKDGKDVDVRKIVTEPGTYEITVQAKTLKDKSNVLYHIRILSRASLESRCETVECPEHKGSFHQFWTSWAPTVGLKPENLHKLAEVGAGPLKDMPPSDKMTSFSFYLIAYSGEF